MEIKRRRPRNPLRDHHNAVREAILKVFLIERRVTALNFRELYLQLDTDGVQLTPDSLKNYLEDMRDRKWLDFETRRTDQDVREIVTIRLLPLGRDVFDGEVDEPGIPKLAQ